MNKVYLCSNPDSPKHAYAADPSAHCPRCAENGEGNWSTFPVEIVDPAPSAASGLAQELESWANSFAANDEGLTLAPENWNQLRSKILEAAYALRSHQAPVVEWGVWSHEHGGWWPANRCGYVNILKAGRFTFEEALAIVNQGNYGMRGSAPEETMMPLPPSPQTGGGSRQELGESR